MCGLCIRLRFRFTVTLKSVLGLRGTCRVDNIRFDGAGSVDGQLSFPSMLCRKDAVAVHHCEFQGLRFVFAFHQLCFHLILMSFVQALQNQSLMKPLISYSNAITSDRSLALCLIRTAFRTRLATTLSRSLSTHIHTHTLRPLTPHTSHDDLWL